MTCCSGCYGTWSINHLTSFIFYFFPNSTIKPSTILMMCLRIKYASKGYINKSTKKTAQTHPKYFEVVAAVFFVSFDTVLLPYPKKIESTFIQTFYSVIDLIWKRGREVKENKSIRHYKHKCILTSSFHWKSKPLASIYFYVMRFCWMEPIPLHAFAYAVIIFMFIRLQNTIAITIISLFGPLKSPIYGRFKTIIGLAKYYLNLQTNIKFNSIYG